MRKKIRKDWLISYKVRGRKIEERERYWLEKLLICCENVEQTIDRFGDNPLIFSKDEDYQKSIKMSCVEIGEILNTRLSDSVVKILVGENRGRFIQMRNKLVHIKKKISMELF